MESATTLLPLVCLTPLLAILVILAALLRVANNVVSLVQRLKLSLIPFFFYEEGSNFRAEVMVERIFFLPLQFKKTKRS